MSQEWIVRFLKENGITLLIVIALVVGYALLRTPGDDFATLEALEVQMAGGQPTVIEFYSNTCSICLITKPQVDRLERDLEGQAVVLRLNVYDAVGRKLAQRWGVRGVPTFVVLDGAGGAIYAQAGAPDTDAIREAVATAIRSD